MNKASAVGAVIGAGLIACAAMVVLRIASPNTPPVPTAVGHPVQEAGAGHEQGGHVTRHPIVVSPSDPNGMMGLDTFSPASVGRWPPSPATNDSAVPSPELRGPSFMPDPTKLNEGLLGVDPEIPTVWPDWTPSDAVETQAEPPLSTPRMALPDGAFWPQDRSEPPSIGPR